MEELLPRQQSDKRELSSGQECNLRKHLRQDPILVLLKIKEVGGREETHSDWQDTFTVALT